MSPQLRAGASIAHILEELSSMGQTFTIGKLMDGFLIAGRPILAKDKEDARVIKPESRAALLRLLELASSKAIVPEVLKGLDPLKRSQTFTALPTQVQDKENQSQTVPSVPGMLGTLIPYHRERS
jgi:hypothetical protein